MSNRSAIVLWPIDYSSMAIDYSSITSITHDVIDYSSMTHRLLIDYYTAHERHFSCFLVPFFFVCDSFIRVSRIFPCI